MIIDEDIYLEHFGTKGMRWGVRKDKPGSKDVRLRKGEKVYNISAGKARDISGKVYTAHRKEDVLNYRTEYATSLMTYRGADKVFTNSFSVSKNIKAAGRDTQVKAFKNLWEKDKEGFSKVLAQTEADAKFSAAIMKKVFKLNREDKYFERYMSRGEKWVEKKGADEFVMRLGVANKAKDPKQKVYFNHLSKQGYNAIVDLNDVKNYGSKEPLLFFRGTTTLGQRKSREFTQADSQKAVDTYRSQKAFDNYILDQ